MLREGNVVSLFTEGRGTSPGRARSPPSKRITQACAQTPYYEDKTLRSLRWRDLKVSFLYQLFPEPETSVINCLWSKRSFNGPLRISLTTPSSISTNTAYNEIHMCIKLHLPLSYEHSTNWWSVRLQTKHQWHPDAILHRQDENATSSHIN